MAPRGARRVLSVAPMMDRSDRHFRMLLRAITRHTLLYTEMITSNAILRGDRHKLLGFDPREKPVVLQLGGDDPVALAECAHIAAELGYDEVNLNCGCPSERVKSGSFGACLMGTPERVADAVAAMRARVAIPVTVKHRIGIDDLDRYEDMARFVEIVAAAGCDGFIVHARKAWLTGLSPAENRNIPPLRYEDVYRLKAEHSALAIEINGGFVDFDAAEAALARGVDGVMIGRAAVDQPMLFADADRRFFGDPAPAPTLGDALERLLPYAEAHLASGGRLHALTRHMLGLMNGRPGARFFRRLLSQNGTPPSATISVLEQAIALTRCSIWGSERQIVGAEQHGQAAASLEA